MITEELINANEVLATLTDDQKSAVLTLSRNDEEQVIANKTREIYDGLDADIAQVSGVAKDRNEKTYDYAKRVLGGYKQKAESVTELEAKVAELTKAKGELESAIANGNADAETKKALKQAQADLSAITKKYTELNDAYNAQQGEFEKTLFDIKVGTEIKTALSGLKFKSSLNDAVKDVVVANVVSKLKSCADYKQEDDGSLRLVFKGADGSTLLNPSKGLAPYSAQELLAKELSEMGVLEKERKQGGAGSKGTEPGDSDGYVDLSGAKTQDEAQEALHKYLTAKGLTRDSKKYQEEATRIWKANESVRKLPIK